jgi:hypothetical protein
MRWLRPGADELEDCCSHVTHNRDCPGRDGRGSRTHVVGNGRRYDRRCAKAFHGPDDIPATSIPTAG